MRKTNSSPIAQYTRDRGWTRFVRFAYLGGVAAATVGVLIAFFVTQSQTDLTSTAIPLPDLVPPPADCVATLGAGLQTGVTFALVGFRDTMNFFIIAFLGTAGILALLGAVALQNTTTFSLGVFSFSVTFLIFCLSGFGDCGLWSPSYPFKAHVNVMAHLLCPIALICIFRQFMESERLTPKLDRWLQIPFAMSLVGLWLIPFSVSFAWHVIPVAGLALVSLMIPISLQINRKGAEKYTKFYVFCWLILSVFAAGYAFRMMGLLREFFRESVLAGLEFPLGLTLGTSALFFALALKIKAIHLRTLESERQAAALAKLASLGVVAGGIAHEINSPLQIVRSAIQNTLLYAQKNALSIDPVIHGQLKEMAAATQKIASITESIGYLARGKGVPTEQVSVDDLMADVLNQIRQLPGVRNVQLTVDVPKGLNLVKGNKTQLASVIKNVLKNAVEEVADAPQPWISVVVAVHGSWLEVAMANSGAKIDEDLAGKIFDPFFTTKAPGEGMGLGLYLSRSIVAGHGGELVLDQRSKETTFLLRLPYA